MTLLLALALLLPMTATAQELSAQVAPRLIVRLPGVCVGPLRLGAQALPCGAEGTTYAVLEDGRAFVVMPFGPRSAINFVGSTDRHPTLETYQLRVDYLRIVEDGTPRELRAAGECQARLSAPQGRWLDLGCAVRGADGQLYAFRFTPH